MTARTEGWPVGLYLAALIARDSDGDVLTISGDDRYVADYLYRESLMQLPEDVQRFLRRTAVLDQLSAPLCDAILEESGCAGAASRPGGDEPVLGPAGPSAWVVSLPRAVPGVPAR